MGDQTLLTVQDLSKVYPNGYEALSNISFSVRAGEFICIIGRSGAGKSTLLRCINGLVPISRGSIKVQGIDVASLSDEQKMHLRRKIGFVFQDFNLIDRLSVFQNVLTGRLGYLNDLQALFGYFGREHREKALSCLQRVNMSHRARYRADNLSGGEKQRVAIARALAQEPLILLADEPVASLDPELSWSVMGDLRKVAKEEGVPTLVNIHDLETARHFADRIIGIAEGKILFDGAPDQLDSAMLQQIYRNELAGTTSRYA